MAGSVTAGGLALLLIAVISERAMPRARTTADACATSSNTVAVQRWLTAIQRSIAGVQQRKHTRRAVPPATVADWCDAISRRLRAGETLRLVLARERPTNVALVAQTEPLRRALDRGESVADAIAAAASASASRYGALDLVWSVLAITSDYGGNTAEPIDGVAAGLRLQSADAQERTVHSAQARLSAHVLTAVPLVVLALLVATDREVRLIVSRPTGWWLVGGGLLLNLCGWSWMRRVVTSQLR